MAKYIYIIQLVMLVLELAEDFANNPFSKGHHTDNEDKARDNGHRLTQTPKPLDTRQSK